MSYKPLRDKQWSRGEHRCCQGCGTIERPHVARGYCKACYRALPDVIAAARAAQALYRASEKGRTALAAQEQRRVRDREKLRAYNAQPEVRERRREWDARPENVERRRQYLASPKGRAIARRSNHLRRVTDRDGDLSAADEAGMRRRRRVCPICKCRLSDRAGLPSSKHLDHIVPVNQGGRHTHANVRIICATCNKQRPRDGSDFADQLPLGVVAC